MNLKYNLPTLNQSNRPRKGESHNVVNYKSMGKDEDSCSRRVALKAANTRREDRRERGNNVINWARMLTFAIQAKEQAVTCASDSIQAPIDSPPYH